MLSAIRGFSDSMAGRIFGVLIAGITASALVASILAGLQRSAEVSAERGDRVVDRIVAALAIDPPPPGTRRLDAMPAGGNVPALADRVTARLPQWTRVSVVAAAPGACAVPLPKPPREGPGPPPPPPPRLDRAPPASACYAVSLAGGDAAPILLAIDAPPDVAPSEPVASTAFLAALGIAVVLLALIVARMAARPIARLAAAAQHFADDLDAAPMVETGPGDVRRASAAFNHMQAQLRRTLEERTYMLAAISHDLRTPLTRLRLRLDGIADAALRDRLVGDARAMASLIEEGLDLARLSRTGGGEVAAVDLAALIVSLCDDARDAGHAVTCAELPRLIVRTQIDALRRILGNLIDNAVLHGGSAEVCLEGTADRARITVLDRGPGIPEGEIERVFDPFRQLDAARSGAHGSGLGLTIARLLARHIGATVTLANREGGGAEATIALEG